MRRLFKFLRNTVISVGLIYVALFAFTKVIHYPEPIAAIKLGLAPASKTPTLMPWHVIDPAAKPVAIPVTSEKMPDEIMYKGTSLAFNEFLKQTDTNVFIVLRNGVMTYEWYKDGITQQSQLPSYSVAKTMTSIMIGQLIPMPCWVCVQWQKVGRFTIFVKHVSLVKLSRQSLFAWPLLEPGLLRVNVEAN